MSLTQPKPPAELWKNGQKRPDCDNRTLVAVQNGLAMSIRRQMAQEGDAVALVALSDELTYCAMNYSGAREVSEDLMTEAIEFTATRFGGLGVGEVREAFRLAAAGELGDVDMKAYYGQFTIVILGAVLSAYQLYRKRIAQAIQRAEQEAEDKWRESVQAEVWSEEGWARERLLVLQAMGEVTMADVGEIDYTTFKKLGWMVVDKTKAEEIWAESERQVRAELATGAMSDIGLRHLLGQVARGLESATKTVHDKRVGWSRRKYVLHWLSTSSSVLHTPGSVASPMGEAATQ